MTSRLMVLIATLLIFFCPVAWASDDDMQFVDARDATGYYVDVSTIQKATAVDTYDFIKDDGTVEQRQRERTVMQARIAVVKANEDRRYLYDVQFDRGHRTYRILTSIVQKYDTKETTESYDEPLPEAPYGVGSPMSELADFVYDWQNEKE